MVDDRYTGQLERDRMFDPMPARVADGRDAYEKWQRSRYVTALDRNPTGTWGDENGDKYSAPFVQAGWEAWQASAMALKSDANG